MDLLNSGKESKRLCNSAARLSTAPFSAPPGSLVSMMISIGTTPLNSRSKKVSCCMTGSSRLKSAVRLPLVSILEIP